MVWNLMNDKETIFKWNGKEWVWMDMHVEICCDKIYAKLEWRISTADIKNQISCNYAYNLSCFTEAMITLSLNMIMHSQSFELVLFHTIHVKIKCHKGSHYPHLLINYLVN